MKKKFYKKIIYSPFISLILLAVVIIVIIWLLPKQFSQKTASPADTIYQKCSVQGKRKITCYDNELTALTKKMPMEEVFSITKSIQKKDADYAYCHVLGHKVAAEEVKKDPANWKQVIARCPSDQCANGCIHGAFQEKLNTENLTDSQIEALLPELKTVCQPSSSWQPSYIDQTACFHALGHMFMYMTSAKMTRSIQLCDQMMIDNTDSDMAKYCYEGAFMQVFQSIEPEDKALTQAIRPRNKSEVVPFCSQFQGIVHATCLNQSWPLYLTELKNDPQFLVNFCSHLEGDNQYQCFGPMLNIMAVQLHFESSAMNQYCSKLPEELRLSCYTRMAGRMIDVDSTLVPRSINFCGQIPELYQEACYSEIIKMLHLGKKLSAEERTNYCQLFPQEFNNKCQKI